MVDAKLVRVRRIELRSQVWKTCILTAVLHPQIDLYDCIILMIYNKVAVALIGCLLFIFWYNVGMGFSSSRFTYNSVNGQFHSSGMTKGDSVTGSERVQSFEQRRQIDKNRKVIGAYKDSAITRTYRNNALSPNRGRLPYGLDSDSDEEDKKKLRRRRTSMISTDDQLSRQRFTSRIDIAKSTRQGFNSGHSVPEETHSKPIRFGIEKPKFGGTQSRNHSSHR